MFTLSIPPALVIGVLISTVLPLLVGLVTKRVTHAGKKAILLAVLSAANGLLTELAASIAAGTAYDIGVGGLTALTGFLVAVGLHYGIYKPTGLSETLQDIGGGDTPIYEQTKATTQVNHFEGVSAPELDRDR